MSEGKTKLKFIAVPFKADSPNGMMSYRGIAKFSFAGIIVEYESKILDMIGGEVKEAHISLNEIADIRFRKGIYKFFGQIQIRLNHYQKISRLPNSDGKIKLNVKRENYDLAQKAVEQMLRFINGDEPASLESVHDTNEQLPPVRTSVNELFDTEKLNK